MILIVMGVSGSGKTTVGKLLAARIGYRFLDADDYHSPANLARMKAGTPLTDSDRASWLETLRNLLAGSDRIVLACSALRQAYRDTLAVDQNVKFVHLRADRDTITNRFEKRYAHFMNPALIDSQFETLEEPKNALTIDALKPPEAAVDEIVALIKHHEKY